jgi:hypothetical protein
VKLHEEDITNLSRSLSETDNPFRDRLRSRFSYLQVDVTYRLRSRFSYLQVDVTYLSQAKFNAE